MCVSFQRAQISCDEASVTFRCVWVFSHVRALLFKRASTLSLKKIIYPDLLLPEHCKKSTAILVSTVHI